MQNENKHKNGAPIKAGEPNTPKGALHKLRVALTTSRLYEYLNAPAWAVLNHVQVWANWSTCLCKIGQRGMGTSLGMDQKQIKRGLELLQKLGILLMVEKADGKKCAIYKLQLPRRNAVGEIVTEDGDIFPTIHAGRTRRNTSNAGGIVGIATPAKPKPNETTAEWLKAEFNEPNKGEHNTAGELMEAVRVKWNASAGARQYSTSAWLVLLKANQIRPVVTKEIHALFDEYLDTLGTHDEPSSYNFLLRLNEKLGADYANGFVSRKGSLNFRLPETAKSIERAERMKQWRQIQSDLADYRKHLAQLGEDHAYISETATVENLPKFYAERAAEKAWRITHPNKPTVKKAS